MKKKIFAVLLAVLMLVPALAGFASAKDYITDKFENAEAKLENMIVSAVSPDGNIYLYFDEFSGELAVKNQATGEILLSNPYDITDRIKDEGLKAQFLSQIYINYRAIGASQSSTYYSYTDCVNYNQLKIVDHYATGILVEYTLGDSRTELLVPLKMTVEDYETLYNKLNYEAQRYFNLHYEKIDPYGKDKYGDDHLPEIRDKWLRQYPISATTPLYVIKPTSLSAPKTVQNIINYIEAQTDYTYEQLLIDYEKVKESTDTFTFGEKANFKFNVKYTVENDGFSAEFDAGSLEYNKEKYYIETVALLPYFGAANRANTGYTFVPDGSGALVRFEDLVAMNRRDTLTVRLYGTDFALYQISERNLEARTMPVFGLINTSGAHAKGFFAIIEDGEALATVLSTHTEQYHNIFSTFKLVSTDTYDLADALSSGISSSKLVGVKADPDDYYD